jgi:hypothetical protein
MSKLKSFIEQIRKEMNRTPTLQEVTVWIREQRSRLILCPKSTFALLDEHVLGNSLIAWATSGSSGVWKRYSGTDAFPVSGLKILIIFHNYMTGVFLFLFLIVFFEFFYSYDLLLV